MSVQDSKTAILLEDINGKFDTILEAMGIMRETMVTKRDLTDVKDELHEARADIKVVKAAVTDSSMQIHGLESRFAQLKAKLLNNK